MAEAMDWLTTLYVLVTAMERGEAVPMARMREALEGTDIAVARALGLGGDGVVSLPDVYDDAEELN